MIKQLLNKIVTFLGIILLMFTAIQSIINNFNLGVVALGIISGLLIAYGYLWRKNKIPKFLHIIVAILCCILVAFAGFLAFGNSDSVNYHEDAVLVLGAGIRGEHVSHLLANRLDKAVEYHEKNPNAIIVVSGGQGPQETISEALAMERYLISQGIPAGQIRKEEKATSSLENFLFTNELLKKELSGEFSLVFITSDFHIYRAKMVSRHAGISAGHIGAPIEWHSVPVSYIREIMAVLQFWVSPPEL